MPEAIFIYCRLGKPVSIGSHFIEERLETTQLILDFTACTACIGRYGIPTLLSPKRVEANIIEKPWITVFRACCSSTPAIDSCHIPFKSIDNIISKKTKECTLP
jgi:hypothetical protein